MNLPERYEGKTGRPPKLAKHPDIQDRLLDSLEEGNPLAVAAAEAGISRKTLYDYRRKGREARHKLETQGEEALGPWDDYYIELLEEIEKREAEIQKKLYKRIDEAGKDNWTADAWILERRWPEVWGKENRHKVVGSGSGGQIQITLNIGEEPDEKPEEEEIPEADYEVIEEELDV